jgi:hypothetical protein
MKRDFDLHQMMRKAEEFTTRGLQKESDEPDITKNYRKTLVKIVNKSTKSQEERDEDDAEDPDRLSMNLAETAPIEHKDFEMRASRVLDTYYRDIYARDCLGYLTDEQVYRTIKNSPKRAKRAAAGLLKQLKKHGICLAEDGSVDYSACKNQNIKNKFMKNPLIRSVLLEEDLNFGSDVLENKQRLAGELKRELEQLETIRNQEEIRKTHEEELKKDPLNTFEKEIGFKYAAVQGLYDDRNQETTKNHDSKGKEEDQEQDAKETVREEQIDHLKEFERGNYQMDSIHKVMEPPELRELRLEKLWLEKRLEKLRGEAGEEEALEQRINALKEVVHKIRRLKIQVDQITRKEAGLKLFEEHDALSEEEFHAESVPFELLQAYFKIPPDVQKLTTKDESEYARVKELIEEKEIVEDLVSPVDTSIQARLEDSSSLEEVEKVRQKRDKPFVVPEIIDESVEDNEKDEQQTLLDLLQEKRERGLINSDHWIDDDEDESY